MSTEFILGTVTGVLLGVLILMQIQVLTARSSRKREERLSAEMVEWVGGPFDQRRFKVPMSQQSVRVRDTDREFYLPIETVAGSRYVVWKEPNE